MKRVIIGHRAFVGVVLIVTSVLIQVPAKADVPVTTTGYIKMSDGVELRYSLVRPARDGRFPILMTYNPYDAGYAVDWAPLLADGFALLGVNMRGTGCSGGRFDPFDSHEGTDGAAAVEWAARQPWSTGRVGMFGQSYSGISQLLVAPIHPRGLVAIAPGHVASDIYRDVVYPGGIYNAGFAALFGFAAQPKRSYSGAPGEIAAGDGECAHNIAEHSGPVRNSIRATAAAFIDSHAVDWRAASPDAGLRAINVPVLSVRSWQDDEVGSRTSYLLEQINPGLLWSVQTNGGHDHPYWDLTTTQKLLERFFLHFVKGDANGWDATPRHQVLHEVTGDVPSWTTTYPSWPPATTPWALVLGDGGALAAEPDADGSADHYVYPAPSPSVPAVDQVSPDFTNASPGWQTPPTPGGSLTYTSPMISRDAEIIGSSSVDLWLASTAPDTDVQVTLSEVRPDGNEAYLQRGWLRASHRREDAQQSTELRPLHTDLRGDAAPLSVGTPVEMRVELLPLDHVFRAGSAIRITIDAPTGGIGDWILDYLHTPAVNTIYHDHAHPSRLVLPLTPGVAQTPYPTCGSVNSEPCRVSIAPVPPGTLQPPSHP